MFCSHAVSKDGSNLDPEIVASLVGHTRDTLTKMYVDAPPDYLDIVSETTRNKPRRTDD